MCVCCVCVCLCVCSVYVCVCIHKCVVCMSLTTMNNMKYGMYGILLIVQDVSNVNN